MMIWRNWK